MEKKINLHVCLRRMWEKGMDTMNRDLIINLVKDLRLKVRGGSEHSTIGDCIILYDVDPKSIPEVLPDHVRIIDWVE